MCRRIVGETDRRRQEVISMKITSKRLKNNSLMKAMDDAVGRSTCVTNAMGTDLMWFLVVTFAAQLIPLSEALQTLTKKDKGPISVAILKHTLFDKLSDAGHDLARLMDGSTVGFDMRGILVPPEVPERLRLQERVLDACTHSISDFSQVVLSKDWKEREDVDMGTFCNTSHVMGLLRNATEDNSAKKKPKRKLDDATKQPWKKKKATEETVEEEEESPEPEPEPEPEP